MKDVLLSLGSLRGRFSALGRVDLGQRLQPRGARPRRISEVPIDHDRLGFEALRHAQMPRRSLSDRSADEAREADESGGLVAEAA